MTLLNLPYLMPDKDRHGNPRIRVRLKAQGQVRTATLKAQLGSPEFFAEYTSVVKKLKTAGVVLRPRGTRSISPYSLGWLAAQYFASPEFKRLDPRSQRNRRQVIESCLNEPPSPGSKLVMRDCPYKRVDAQHILMLRDRRAGRPGAANNRLKYLGAMFSWAIERGEYGVGRNPCRDVKKLRFVSDGFYTWTIDDARRYVERHPIGTMAYLAFALMLFLGARRQDVVRLGPRHMRDDTMVYVPLKTTYRRVEESVKPILPPLAEAIRRTPHGLNTFLVTANGRPYTDAGIGNRMREWCDQAGLPECTAHGLKKLAATICAEGGATDRQMMALFDWTSERMANIYTARANKRKLANVGARSLGFFDPDDTRTD